MVGTIKNTLVATLMGLGLLMLGQGAAQADSLESIKSAGVLRVAVPQDSPPFGMSDANLELVGYDIDVAKLIADKLGVSIEMTPVVSANRVPFLTTNRVDIIVSSLGKNAEREAVIDFSDAYAPFFSGVFGPADSGVAAPADLAGKTIAVTRGAIEDLKITEMAPSDANIQRFEDGNTTMAAFLSGQADVIVTGNTVAATVLSTNPSRRPEVLFTIQDSPCYIGVGKGEAALQQAINEIIAEAKADGTLNEISRRWLQADLPAGF